MKVKCPERATIVSRASMLEIEWAKGPWLDLDMIALGHSRLSRVTKNCCSCRLTTANKEQSIED